MDFYFQMYVWNHLKDMIVKFLYKNRLQSIIVYPIICNSFSEINFYENFLISESFILKIIKVNVFIRAKYFKSCILVYSWQPLQTHLCISSLFIDKRSLTYPIWYTVPQTRTWVKPPKRALVIGKTIRWPR